MTHAVKEAHMIQKEENFKLKKGNRSVTSEASKAR